MGSIQSIAAIGIPAVCVTTIRILDGVDIPYSNIIHCDAVVGSRFSSVGWFNCVGFGAGHITGRFRFFGVFRRVRFSGFFGIRLVFGFVGFLGLFGRFFRLFVFFGFFPLFFLRFFRLFFFFLLWLVFLLFLFRLSRLDLVLFRFFVLVFGL